MSNSIDFFETQFVQQVGAGELLLNPFEVAALPYLHGSVLEFGCGLGNLAIAAARQGCQVLALDAAPTAIAHLAQRSEKEHLAVRALVADLRAYDVPNGFDAIVAIGVLMFFCPATARAKLFELQSRVRPGGLAVVNVLIEGTTFLEMFDPVDHYLFKRDELREAFAGWEIISESFDNFPAAGNTQKCFTTLIARKN